MPVNGLAGDSIFVFLGGDGEGSAKVLYEFLGEKRNVSIGQRPVVDSELLLSVPEAISALLHCESPGNNRAYFLEKNMKFLLFYAAFFINTVRKIFT